MCEGYRILRADEEISLGTDASRGRRPDDEAVIHNWAPFCLNCESPHGNQATSSAAMTSCLSRTWKQPLA
jgi:hypothetical protein